MMLLFLGCVSGPAEGPGREPVVDSEPADTGDPTGPTDTEALLDRLRADLEGTLLAVSRDTGWPAPVADGWLFVQTDRGEWDLAGDMNGWAGVPMTRDDGFSWLVHPADPGDAYKFTDGEAWNADPWSRAYAYDEYGEKSLVAPEGTRLERQFAVDGEGLAARDLHLLVPAGTPTHVLYMHDGQNLFDPQASPGSWRLDESVPEGMLVVGIDNTVDRMEEYTHVEDWVYGAWYGGWGDRYADFVQNTVRPLVREIYGEPAVVGTMGSSLGGLISLYIAHRHPGEYAFAGSMSGTVGWGSIGADHETILDLYAASGHRDTAIYLDSGGSGSCYDADGDGMNDDDPSASDNYCENLQLRDQLAGQGYVFEVDLWHWWEPYAEHNESAWAARVYRPLGIFAGL